MFKRIVVVAPTRSTCVNLRHLIGLASLPETLLTRECGEELQAAIAELPLGGFGIVAGTGTGKSAAIREICRQVLKKQRLDVGVVTLEHQADDATRKCDVLVITPGVAVMWAKRGTLGKSDLIVCDEVHQTSEHSELAMALLKRIGCTFVWMSATIDPSVYQEYLGARRVIACTAYDEARRAEVTYHRGGSAQRFLQLRLSEIAAGERGVAIFVPSRAEAEALANEFNGQHGVYVDFYHGGESAEKLRAFIEGSIPRPYVIAMTSAGASSLNLTGLDTVAIVDRCFTQVIKKGRLQLVSQRLDPNTLLQMAGRVDGRALSGQVHIMTDNLSLDLRAIRPEAPRFVLGGALESLALTSASLGVDARELDLIGGLDHDAYDRVFSRFVARQLIAVKDGVPELTSLGKKCERLPVEVAWAEIVVRAQAVDNPELFRVVCLTACTNELFKLTIQRRTKPNAEVWAKRGDPLTVEGSDHLTSHNIVAEALRLFGRSTGREYRLKGAPFSSWCKAHGYSSREIQNIALLASSLFRQLGLELPEPTEFAPVYAGEEEYRLFIELLAVVQSMDYVHNGRHDERHVYGNDMYGVSYGQSVLGAIRLWTDKSGRASASVEGTEIPFDVVERNLVRGPLMPLELAEDGGMRVSFTQTFAGQLIRASRSVVSLDELPAGLARSFRNEDTWRRWVRPTISLPDLSSDDVVVPEVVVHAYGVDGDSGARLLAYGVVAWNSSRYYPHDPWFKAAWTRNEAEAKGLRAEAVAQLESARDQAKAAAELLRVREEAEAVRVRAERLYYDQSLEWKLRTRVFSYTHFPNVPSAWPRWTREALEVVPQVEAVKLEIEAMLRSLLEAARALRGKANALLIAEEDKFYDTEEYESLYYFDVDDSNLPPTVGELENWIAAAEAAIAAAEKAIQFNDDSQPVSAEDLAALAAKFGRS
jgi:hypothetical protein